MDPVKDSHRTTRRGRRFSRALLALAALAVPVARAAPPPAAPAGLPALVTIAQFEQFLSVAGKHPRDAKFAAQLAGLLLTERAGSARLARWLEEFSGPRTRRALTALADLSAFEDLPAADVAARPAPALATQRQILARTVEYVAQIRPTLPNFSALRSTTRFEIGTRDDVLNEERSVRLFGNSAENAVYQPLGRARTSPDRDEWLYFAASSSTPVTYRDGSEVSGAENSGQNLMGSQPPLTTSGEFGPILGVVLGDAEHGKIEWSHWETGANKVLAVFRYSVPAAVSHYTVFDSSSAQGSFPAYHGEMAIDPDTGALLRILLLADMSTTDVSESGIVVDYGPVEIAGKTYICPLRSIALSRASVSRRSSAQAQWHTFLNDVSFTGYHVFRSEMRIVPEGSAGP